MVTTLLPETVWKVYRTILAEDPADNVTTLDPSLHVLNVMRSVGGRSAQIASLLKETLNMRASSVHQDQYARSLFADSQRIDITRTTLGGLEVVVHVGYIVGGEATLKHTEELTLTSRFDEHLLHDDGQAISELEWISYYLDASTPVFEKVSTDLDLVFNPIVNKIPRQNCYYDDAGTTEEYPYPFDPDGMPADKIETPPTDVHFWTLADAVYYLLKQCNADETHLQNPTRAAINAQLSTDPEMIRHFKVRRGSYLPEVLDALLNPFGYTWMYSYGSVGDKVGLYFWKRSAAGTTSAIGLQRYGAVVDLNYLTTPHTDVEGYNISFDNTSCACSGVKAQGGITTYEFSADLVPAWDPTLDSTPIKDLVEDSAAMRANPALRRVHRDWVLNEGGDYGDFAGESDRVGGAYESGLGSPYDFTAVFGVVYWLSRRRRLLPMITIDPESRKPSGFHSGVRVQIWKPSTGKWHSPQELGIECQIIKDECGVRLGSLSQPPLEMKSLFAPTEADPDDSVKVRVTASVESDFRVSYTTPAAPTLVHPVKNILLDVGSKYAYAKVSTQSDYYGDTAYDKREYDATDDLQQIADFVLSQWNAATAGGTITLIGTGNVNEFLGWQITGLQDRNFQLHATHASATTSIYPQVIAVHYHVQSQRTVLTLDAYRQDLRRY